MHVHNIQARMYSQFLASLVLHEVTHSFMREVGGPRRYNYVTLIHGWVRELNKM